MGSRCSLIGRVVQIPADISRRAGALEGINVLFHTTSNLGMTGFPHDSTLWILCHSQSLTLRSSYNHGRLNVHQKKFYSPMPTPRVLSPMILSLSLSLTENLSLSVILSPSPRLSLSLSLSLCPLVRARFRLTDT
jgi:hypothetical protein